MPTILVTGAGGFIGFHVSKKLLEKNYKVIGIDNFNEYYDKSLKEARINQLTKNKNFILKKLDITNLKELKDLFKKFKIDKI